VIWTVSACSVEEIYQLEISEVYVSIAGMKISIKIYPLAGLVQNAAEYFLILFQSVNIATGLIVYLMLHAVACLI
jgi:hypothetical protein